MTPVVPDAMDVSGKTTEEIGDLAARLGLVLHELSPQSSSLEEAFLELTAGSQEYRTGAAELRRHRHLRPRAARHRLLPAASASPDCGRQPVTAVIHSEWIKLRSVRSNLIVFTVAVLLAVGVAIIVAIVADPVRTHNDITLATGGVQIANLLFGILGVQIIGQEYRFNTIRPTFTAVPNRRNVLLSKLIVIIGATLAFGVVMMVLSVTVVRAFGPGDVALDGPAYRAIIGGIAFSLGYSAFGFAVGAILRQPVAGIILILAWVVRDREHHRLAQPAVGRWMPFFEGGQMAIVDRNDASNGRTSATSCLVRRRPCTTSR